MNICMNIGIPPDLSWYKLLTDWGSLIGGVTALIAGITAYSAGCRQAAATRQAAQMQVEAEQRKYNQDVETVRKSLAIELRLVVERAFGTHNSLAGLISRTNGLITARMVDSSVGMPVPIVYPAVADRIALLKNAAMDLVIIYQLVEIARDGASRLIHWRTPDDIPPQTVAAVADVHMRGKFCQD
jgi:hypothetical protein